MGWILFAIIVFLSLFLLLSGIRDWVILIWTMDDKLLVAIAMIIMIGVAIWAG